MSTDKIAIATRLKAARKIAGYKTAKEFCHKFDVPESSYSTHENGLRGIKEPILQQYAKYLKFNFKWLAAGQGKPFADDNFSAEQNDLLQTEIELSQKKLSQSTLDQDLLETILEKFFDSQKQNNITAEPKSISHITAQIYSDVCANSDDPKVRKSLIDAILRPYIMMLKQKA